MAFGTGLHATTRYCLAELEKQTPVDKVVDVGTGSAILAMAYAKLHPQSEIWAVDTDQVAIDVAEVNCELNAVSDRIKLITGSTDIVVQQKFGCILSNLTCEDIIALLPDYVKMLDKGGTVICAGILTEKLPLLEKALAEHGLSIIHSTPEGMWTGVTCQLG